jgi:hypothetical protein
MLTSFEVNCYGLYRGAIDSFGSYGKVRKTSRIGMKATGIRPSGKASPVEDMMANFGCFRLED